MKPRTVVLTITIPNCTTPISELRRIRYHRLPDVTTCRCVEPTALPVCTENIAGEIVNVPCGGLE